MSEEPDRTDQSDPSDQPDRADPGEGNDSVDAEIPTATEEDEHLPEPREEPTDAAVSPATEMPTDSPKSGTGDRTANRTPKGGAGDDSDDNDESAERADSATSAERTIGEDSVDSVGSREDEGSTRETSGADDGTIGDGTDRLRREADRIGRDTGRGFGEGEPTDQYERGMGPSDLDRAFSILERAFSSDALGGQQLDQLLTVFEDVFTSGESDPEAMAELISLLEEVIIQPSDLGQVDVSGILSIIEEAVSETTRADREDIADVMAVLEEGLLDPTGLEPEDVERFHAGLENAILDLTDPNTTGLGGLFAIPERIAEETGVEVEYGDEIDLFRIARVAAGMTQRATGYTMESGIRTGTRMAYAAANSQSPAELLTNTRAIALDELQRAGIDIGEEQQHWLELHEDELIDTRPLTRESLAERGEELLQASAEIGRDESVHPSYPMVLEQLASDEARMLRLIAREGPQGVVDVYARRYIPFSLYPVAQDMTMLGADAGCRYKQRTPVYVQNLQRLGLVRITDQPIPNPNDYQVLEAQPHVEAARDSVRRPRIAYKRIELTAFGIEFCEMCFPFEVRIDSPRLEFRAENET